MIAAVVFFLVNVAVIHLLKRMGAVPPEEPPRRPGPKCLSEIPEAARRGPACTAEVVPAVGACVLSAARSR